MCSENLNVRSRRPADGYGIFCGIFLYGTDVGIQDDNGFPDSVQCLRLHLLWDVI